MSEQKPSDAKTNWSMGAALGAGVAASACCTIPLALVSLGIGGAWIGSLTALEPYRAGSSSRSPWGRSPMPDTTSGR